MQLSKSIRYSYIMLLPMHMPFYTHSQHHYHFCNLIGHSSKKYNGPHLLTGAFSTSATTTTTSAPIICCSFAPALTNNIPTSNKPPAFKQSSSFLFLNNKSNNARQVFATAAYATKTSSSFVAPEPPSFQGQAVFPDIDLTSLSDDAVVRNENENAVFVVTGASRGIGLQIVKDLTQRTKMRQRQMVVFSIVV
jgi:hypothetical protein